MPRGKRKIIMGNGTRFNVAEHGSLHDGSRLWAVWDNETQEFVKNTPGFFGDTVNIVEFYRYDDALELRNTLELKRLANKKTNLGE